MIDLVHDFVAPELPEMNPRPGGESDAENRNKKSDVTNELVVREKSCGERADGRPSPKKERESNDQDRKPNDAVDRRFAGLRFLGAKSRDYPVDAEHSPNPTENAQQLDVVHGCLMGSTTTAVP